MYEKRKGGGRVGGWGGGGGDYIQSGLPQGNPTTRSKQLTGARREAVKFLSLLPFVVY